MALSKIQTSEMLDTPNLGRRNRIINGGMKIDQRNAGASVTYASGGSELYFVDRWAGNSTGSTRFSMQRSTVAPAGFANSLLITTTTAGTPASGNFCYFKQDIEGLNSSDLGFGTADAQTVTLSFWTRSSLTGTFGGSLSNSAANRRYPFPFTISVANTWEYKTITITGDTTGTWLTDNGRGIGVVFNLGTGSANKSTANAWGTTGISPTGSVDLVATASATFYITGIQLEVGDTATPFEHRSFGEELSLCQRYFYTPAPANTTHRYLFPLVATGSTGAFAVVLFPIPLRATPTLDITISGGSYRFRANLGTVNGNSVSTNPSLGGNDSQFGCRLDWSSGFSGLTADKSGWLTNGDGGSGYFGFDAEL